jgi:hypothetical protein
LMHVSTPASLEAAVCKSQQFPLHGKWFCLKRWEAVLLAMQCQTVLAL